MEAAALFLLCCTSILRFAIDVKCSSLGSILHRRAMGLV
jgi:hypothetical protein